jgi:hypothetical protein
MNIRLHASSTRRHGQPNSMASLRVATNEFRKSVLRSSRGAMARDY